VSHLSQSRPARKLSVAAIPRKARRRSKFNFSAKRRQEIVLHARYVGAAETADFGRWLIAWYWHNPKAIDPIWSLMEAAKRMGGRITEAEASVIAEAASIRRKHLSADNLARFLGITYAQRQALQLTTIGSINVKRRARKELRRRRWRLNAQRRRREQGARPQSESLSQTRPWEAENMSRAKWYRRRTVSRETTSSTPSLESGRDESVSAALRAAKRATRRGAFGPAGPSAPQKASQTPSVSRRRPRRV
jgi:hypothetical protein